jgi:hypothetical protein
MPFKQAARALLALHRLAVSASWLQKLIKPIAKQAHKDLLRECQEPLQNDDKEWSVMQMDGSQVPLKSSWEEAKSMVIGNLSKTERGKIHSRWYHATKSGVTVFERDAKKVLRQRNVDLNRLICMGDGAPWIWKMYKRLAPNAVQILDFYHASEHVFEIMTLIYGTGSDLADEEHRRMSKVLKDTPDGPEQIMACIERHIGNKSLAAEEVQKRLNANLTYFRTHKERMRYAFFKAKGWPIGTGLVESTQKWLLQARIKRPGMHWSRPGVSRMIGLRVQMANQTLEGWFKRFVGAA